MSDSFANDFFKDARQALNRYRLARLLTCLFLLVFHLAIYNNYVELYQKKLKTNADERQYALLYKSLAAAETSISKGEKLFDKALSDLLKNVTRKLRSRFSALTDAMQRRSHPEMDEADRLLGGPLQLYIAQDAAVPIEDDTLQKLLDKQDKDAIKNYLPEYIEKSIIEPVFQTANDEWNHKIRPAYEKELNGAISALPKLSEVPTANIRADINIVRAEIKHIIDQGKKIAIQPPVNAGWWRTLQGKQHVEKEIQDTILAQMDRRTSLKSTLNQIDEVLKKSREYKAAYNEKTNQMKTLLQEQKNALRKLGIGFSFLAIDLETLVRLFPLFIGLLIGISVHLYAGGFRNLQTALLMLETENRSGVAVQLWFSHAIFRDISFFDKSNINVSRALLTKKTNSAMCICSAIFVIVGAGWVLLAWYQAQSVPSVGHFELVVSILSIALSVYELYRAKISLHGMISHASIIKFNG